MPDDIKRVNYFDRQFLRADDFKTEQTYHLEQRRRHNKHLHSPGVAEGGLEVTRITDSDSSGSPIFKLSISPGIAIDSQGREIILSEPREEALSDDRRNTDVYILYGEKLTAPSTDPGSEGFTRITESPSFSLVPSDSSAPEDGLLLARISEGNSPDNTVRQIAGSLIIGDRSITESKLADGAVSNRVINDRSITEPKLADDAISNRVIQDRAISLNKLVPIVQSQITNALPLSGGTISRDLAVNGFLQVGNYIEFGRTFTGDSIQIGTITGATRRGLVTSSGVENIFNGPTTFYGRVNFSGGKPGYVIDQCINKSGEALHTGDVVKLKGTSIRQFKGSLSRIPIPEVTLADEENDTALIGIVDSEVPPDLNTPDIRIEPNDPTSIEDGGEVYVVTLGTYAHCKVDATKAAIEVGDLLTTSNNPGHAQKATDPRIGSIIGKALEPLRDGTGYIAVFVNIQ